MPQHGELSIDDRVRESESQTAYRNRAIGHLLRGAGRFDGDPDEIVESYIAQCSVLVDCRDLAVISATLAAGGRNPVTGQQVASPDTVRDVLSVMATAGMYDAAGDWLYDVGLLAKSGVAGGVIAVLPNLFLQIGNSGGVQNLPFGGTAVLIMIGVGLDTVKQIESQLMQRNYEGFLK